MAKRKPTKSAFEKAQTAHKKRVKQGEAAQKIRRKNNPGGAPQDKAPPKAKTPKAPKVKASAGKPIIDKVGGSVGRAALRHPYIAGAAAIIGAGYMLAKGVKPKKTGEKGRAFSFGGADVDIKVSKKDPNNAPNPNVRKPAGPKKKVTPAGPKKKVSSADPFAALSVDAKPANKNNFKGQSSGSVRPPTKESSKKVTSSADPYSALSVDALPSPKARTQEPKTKTNVKENFDSTVKGHKKMSELTESAIGHAKTTAKTEAKMPKSSGTSLAPKGTNEAPKPLNTAPSSSTLAPKTTEKGDYSFEDKKAARTAPAKPRNKATVEKGDYAYEDKRAARSADVQQNRYTKEGLFKAGKFGVFGGGGVKTAADKKAIAKRKQKRDDNRK